jgi:sugar phosphate isomerase/epimerase
MEKIKLGIQLYSLRKYLQKPENIRGVFEKVRDMGADVVQVSGMCPMDSKELARISTDTNLPICITHASVDRIKKDLDKLAEEHLDFACKNIGIGMMPREYQKDNDSISLFVEFLNTTAEKLKKFDMTIAYHNHDFEFTRFDGQIILDRLIDETIPEVEFIPDTCWIQAGGFKSEEYIEKMSGRINTIHLKDYRKIFFMHMPMAIGDGILDFKSIMASAEKHGVKNAVIELDSSLNPMRFMRKSMKRLSAIY